MAPRRTAAAAALSGALDQVPDVDPALAGNLLYFRHVDTLVGYARNSRTHSPAQVDKIAASFAEFGFTNPILADKDGNVAAGHGRIMAVRRLMDQGRSISLPNGAVLPAGFVPVVDCTGWSDAQRRAYVIADNQIALAAGWDEALLSSELADLSVLGFDLALTGFDASELAALLAEPVAPRTDPDDVPGLPETPVSVPGDTWLLGAHRVRCGDSTVQTEWDALMAGGEADCCWTDPPYNVAYESKLAGSIKNDSMKDDAFRAFLLDAFTALATVMRAGAAIYVAHADTEGLNFRATFREAGFKLSGCLIWRKDSLVLGRSDFQWQHEPILYGWKPGAAHQWFGGRKQTTVSEWNAEPVRQMEDGSWAITVGDTVLHVSGEATVSSSSSSVVFHEKPKRSAEHPTMKPVALVERLLKNSARSGDVIVDAFGGSGSTLIAAERLAMRARLMELDPRFVDVIVRRWQEHVGREAVLEGDGRTFAAVTAERLPGA